MSASGKAPWPPGWQGRRARARAQRQAVPPLQTRAACPLEAGLEVGSTRAPAPGRRRSRRQARHRPRAPPPGACPPPVRPRAGASIAQWAAAGRRRAGSRRQSAAGDGSRVSASIRSRNGNIATFDRRGATGSLPKSGIADVEGEAYPFAPPPEMPRCSSPGTARIPATALAAGRWSGSRSSCDARDGEAHPGRRGRNRQGGSAAGSNRGATSGHADDVPDPRARWIGITPAWAPAMITAPAGTLSRGLIWAAAGPGADRGPKDSRSRAWRPTDGDGIGGAGMGGDGRIGRFRPASWAQASEESSARRPA